MDQINRQLGEAAIEEECRRANRRLMASLDEQQRRQAVEEFRVLYEQEMGRARTKAQRGLKVLANLRDLQRGAEAQQRDLQAGLKQRMQVHFKKRELLHLQKLTNYRRVDLQWRDRLNSIASQARDRQKQHLLLSSSLAQQALQFWQQKEQKSRPTPRATPHKPRYFSHDHTQDLTAQPHTRFLTEAIDTGPHRQRLNEPCEPNFPSIRRRSALQTEGEGREAERGAGREAERGAGSKSVAIERPRSEVMREHLMRSSELWEEREGANLQRAMQKLELIERTRSKARQKLAHESQRIRHSRMLREDSREQRFFNIKQEQAKKSQRGADGYSTHKPASSPSPRLQQEQSRVQRRREALLESAFQDRGRHFQEELRKEQQGGFRRMVREAVQEAVQSKKLQALQASSRA